MSSEHCEQPHAAAFGDKDVRRLQIAVHDQARVRVRHRGRNLQQQREALAQRQRMRRAVTVDRRAVDILERQVQAGDVRVLERSEDVSFARQAYCQPGGPADVRQLQRDLAKRLAVDPLGEPDRPHSALAELGEQPVRADRRARRCAVAGRCRAERQLRQRGEKVPGLDVGAIAEELAQLGLDRIGLVQRVEPGVALGGSEREDFVEPATDRRPVGGEVLKVGHAILVRCAKRG